jgi:hypothetical protein
MTTVIIISKISIQGYSSNNFEVSNNFILSLVLTECGSDDNPKQNAGSASSAHGTKIQIVR